MYINYYVVYMKYWIKSGKGSLKKFIKKTKVKRKQELKHLANSLNNNLPSSEKWFNSLYSIHKHNKDMNNQVVMGYIPDVVNEEFKYIIEIDGSIHDSIKTKKKDHKKSMKFWSKGYSVIRIKAYDIKSFNDGLLKIKQIRKEPLNKL